MTTQTGYSICSICDIGCQVRTSSESAWATRFNKLICVARALVTCLLAWVVSQHSGAEDAEPLKFYVDAPLEQVWTSSELTINGWAWGGQQDPVIEVSIEAGEWRELLTIALERVDVASALGIPDAVRSGFYGALSLPATVEAGSQLSLVAHRRSGERVMLKVFDYEPQTVSQRWRSWLNRYPAWRDDVFWFVPGTSGVSSGDDQGFTDAYEDFQSETLRAGLRVPVLYMRTTDGRAGDWHFNPAPQPIQLPNGRWVADDWLGGLVDLAVTEQLPILFTLNGGVWGDAYSAGPDHDLIDYLELDPMNCQWDQNDRVFPDGIRKDLPGSLPSPELSRMLTLNALNETVRGYKSRNLKAAGRFLSRFAEQHPELFIGINLDADLYLSPFVKGSWHDFNPDTLTQFRQWLSGSGLYGDEGKLEAYREHKFTLDQLSLVTGSTYASWDEVEPPREVPLKFLPAEPTDEWLFLWERFRRHLVDLHYDDMSRWLVEAGISPEKIFSSQAFIESRKWVQPFAETLDSPIKNFDSAGVTVEGGKPARGHLGAIIYGKSATNEIDTESGRSLFRIFYDTDPDWGVVEHSTADFRDPPKQIPSYSAGYRSLRDMFNYHAQLISPMAWNGAHGEWVDQPGFHAHTAFRRTPMESAVKDFLREYAFLPRRALYWTFGSSKHSDNDNWTSEHAETISWPELGKLNWHHPSGVSSLVSPDELAIDPGAHRTLVIGSAKTYRIKGLGVDYRERSTGEEWQTLVPIRPVADLERDDAGWVLSLPWSDHAKPSQLRLIFDMRVKGKSSLDHVAILPTGVED